MTAGRTWVAGLLVLAAAGCAGSGSAGPSGNAAASSPAAVATPSASSSPSPTPSSTPAATPDPGRLPQTTASPSATDPAFTARMRDFWSAVIRDRPAAALPPFLPLGAYQQVKALADPAADWRGRLVSQYDLDLGVAHRLVGPGATLQGVDVPAQAARWVQPGEEYNKLGYWRVYGTRLRYRTAAGRTGSFGIFSLISWRGQWYVVHLGPISRPAGTGAIVP